MFGEQGALVGDAADAPQEPWRNRECSRCLAGAPGTADLCHANGSSQPQRPSCRGVVVPSSESCPGALSRPGIASPIRALSPADEAWGGSALVRTDRGRGGSLPVSGSSRVDPPCGQSGRHGELGDTAGDVQPPRNDFGG